jgi:hypothetical protein
LSNFINQYLTQASFQIQQAKPLFSIQQESAGTNKKTNYFDFVLAGVLGMALMNSSVQSIAIGMSKYREDKILKRITTTPLRTWKFIVAEVSSRLVLNLVQISVILALGLGVFKGHFYGNYFVLFLLALLGGLLFQLIGFTIAGVSKNTDAAEGLATFATIPMMFLAGVFFPIDGLLCAQYPGQYPPGQYPPGRYPGDQTPFPRLPIPGRGKRSPGDKRPSSKEVLQQFTGKIQKIEKDSFAIEAPDTRVVTFKCSKNTKYLQGGKEIQRAVLKPGDEVDVEACSDEEGYFYAVNVKLTKAAERASGSGAPETGEAAPDEQQQKTITGVTVPEDPDRPKLHRGKPAPRPRASDEEPEAAPSPDEPGGSSAPGAPKATDALLEQARKVADEFSEALPNYICNQFTTRYEGEGHPISWRPLDVVSAAVAYEDGKESYHDIRIDNKPVNKPMEQISGSWSRGEFGTTLRDLFSPATAADFQFRGGSTASGRSASVYDFQVEQPNSHWQSIMAGQSVLPAYKGSVWIDKKTARILRIEMQARKIPEAFPLDTVEWVVDYSFVRIGDGEFLLPVHAENLSCWRGTSRCARNAIDFRNYRRFTSESQITTTDSTINYDAEEPPKPSTKKK